MTSHNFCRNFLADVKARLLKNNTVTKKILQEMWVWRSREKRTNPFFQVFIDGQYFYPKGDCCWSVRAEALLEYEKMKLREMLDKHRQVCYNEENEGVCP